MILKSEGRRESADAMPDETNADLAVGHGRPARRRVGRRRLFLEARDHGVSRARDRAGAEGDCAEAHRLKRGTA